MSVWFFSKLKSLRTNDGSGKLRLDGHSLLPRLNSSDTASHRFAGDVRALEMPGLATMHTLWARCIIFIYINKRELYISI